MTLLTTYGYGAVFACIAIESTGIPFPGETMLLVATIYAGTTHQLAPVNERLAPHVHRTS